VTLKAPTDDQGTTVYWLVDQVVYDDRLPWPASADGTGNSLSRNRLSDFGNAAASWLATTPSPGTTDSRGGPSSLDGVAGDANRDGRFDRKDIVLVLQAGKYLSGEKATWEADDWNLDGVFNQLDLVAALRAGTYLRP